MRLAHLPGSCGSLPGSLATTPISYGRHKREQCWILTNVWSNNLMDAFFLKRLRPLPSPNFPVLHFPGSLLFLCFSVTSPNVLQLSKPHSNTIYDPILPPTPFPISSKGITSPFLELCITGELFPFQQRYSYTLLASAKRCSQVVFVPSPTYVE